MPLTTDRNTKRRAGDDLNVDPVAAATHIFAGALACLDANGNLVPGSTSTTLKARGRAEENVDNSAGAAGDKSAKTRKGVFQFANDGTDTIDRTHIEGTAYIVDDETVAATDGTGTRSAAGTIVDVDAQGVWVRID